MKYIYLTENKIRPVSENYIKFKSNCIYANEEEKPRVIFKDLIVEEKPTYDEKTQKLFSWFENGDVITQKFKIVDKEEI